MKLEIPKIIIRPNEQWKLVCTNGTSSYYISNYGRVKADTNKGISILKTQIANGYERVHILSKMYFIHRLVALHFVKNEDEDKYIEVNHIDNNRLNNKFDNLEWVTPKQNSQAKENIKIYKLDLEDNILEEFNSTTDAAISVNGDRGAIAKCCRQNYSKTNIYKGYKWKYSNYNFKNNYSNKPRKVAKICPYTNKVLFVFNCITDAAKDINVGKTCIYNVILGYAKLAGGFKYKYV